MELHEALSASDLTTLRITRGRTGFDLRLSRDWDPVVDWSDYATTFQVDQVPCVAPVVMGGAAARAHLKDIGAGPSLDNLISLMRAGRHEMVHMHVHAELGMRAVNHVHSSTLGANNGHHAIRAGGVRRHDAGESEGEVLIDGLNLGRGMSFKNAAAQIPFGGCKMTVQCAPFALDDLERLGFLAHCIDAGHFFTGPDMGFSPSLADALRARFTHNIVGGPGGAMGPTGTPTARGTFMAMRECAHAAWGSEDLAGKRVLIQGLGAVGLPLATLVNEAGAELWACDQSPEQLAAARERFGQLNVVDADSALLQDCDVLSPNAVGGVFDAGSIDNLSCSIICGAANNQLRAVSREEEEALAERVRGRGIVYPPEWTHNVAGVVAGYEEYKHQEEAAMGRLDPHLERVCRLGTRDRLARAAERACSPTALAYRDVESQIDSGLGARDA